MTRILALFLAVSVSCGSVITSAQALVIQLSFGSGYDSEVKKDVARAAANWWEMAITTKYTVQLTTDILDLSALGAVGRMHSNTETAMNNPTTGTKLPKSAAVELNSKEPLYFDPKPHKNEEFNMNMENGLFGMCNRAACMGKWDALSVLKHEMGHALGFSRITGMFSDGKPFAAYTDIANNFTGDTYVFDWLTTGKEGNKNGTGGALQQVRFDADSHIDGTGDQAGLNKKLMAYPGFLMDQRSLQTPLDIDIIGDAFHLQINDMPMHMPEPPTFVLFGFGFALMALWVWPRRPTRSQPPSPSLASA